MNGAVGIKTAFSSFTHEEREYLFRKGIFTDHNIAALSPLSTYFSSGMG